MSNDQNPQIVIVIERKSIENISETVHLGHLISYDNRTNKEINRRIATTSWEKFWELKDILKGPY